MPKQTGGNLTKVISLYEAQERYEEELQILNEVAAIEPYNEEVDPAAPSGFI
jgi:DNA-binding SARP family transcriptional activator